MGVCKDCRHGGNCSESKYKFICKLSQQEMYHDGTCYKFQETTDVILGKMIDDCKEQLERFKIYPESVAYIRGEIETLEKVLKMHKEGKL